MQKAEMFEVMRNNPAFHLATLEGDTPRCRAMFLYRADEEGILFHTGAMKDVYRQIQNHPKVELCFNDFKNGVQVRVSGTLEEVEDHGLKDEISAHPTRAFLKPWRESGPLENFYAAFKIFRLQNGQAVAWTMASNFTPKTVVTL
jgi:uncharacterized pyridoxamine 5'-phosphate oxidase family protein